MSITQLNPYLNFNGTAEQAIRHYERALGAKLEGLQRFGEVPGMSFPAEHHHRVMHAMLKLGEGTIMVSDTMPGSPECADSNVQVVLHFDDASEMAQRFDALAAGGKVTMPIGDTFWGAKFGMLRDAYGIQWMFNCQNKQA